MQKDNLAEASDVLSRIKRMLAFIGIWPKDSNNLRFAFHFAYICIHVATEYANLIQCIGNFERILDNLTESISYTIVLVKMIVFRKNRTLSKLIDTMNEDCVNHKYTSLEEQGLYATYNSMTKNFYKTLLFLVAVTSLIYYLRPLAEYLFASSNNETIQLVLPYRTRFFYEMTEVYRYAVAYAYQVVALYMVIIGWVGSDGLLISLTMHVCGQLSILAENIVNLKIDARNGSCPEIRSIVERHLRLIWMAQNIDTVFTVVLAGQLMGSTLLICLSGFNLLVNAERTQITSMLLFIVYEASMLGLLYSHSFIGECLIQESEHVRDAFYQCNWYEMSTSQSKDLIICMARSQKPLCLTTGKFYIFSMENFTEVIKLSFTYLSVLRTLM